MKRLLITAISIIAAIGATTPALAQKIITTNTRMAREVVEISPYDLVTAGYQGRFKERGVPSAGRFITAIRTNNITAEDLVKVGIADRRLSEDTLNDESYIRQVDSVLDSLDKN
ncbi:hypothetical protein IQ255_17615 [Pleurocapsales cyanobacterium LEGE 10410]|nr:hypothetical protein [Pleurocapsales cyanobacterium LEGE 10410]